MCGIAGQIALSNNPIPALSPGLVVMSRLIAHRGPDGHGQWESDDGRAAAANLLLGRLTRAQDIASACLFLLSDDARQITGQILDVDGGNHLSGGGWTPVTDPAIQALERPLEGPGNGEASPDD